MATPTTIREVPVASAQPKASRAPMVPLQGGDKLSRDEFERRYSAMPSQVRAELVEGIVHMPSPVRYQSHGSPHGHVIFWAVSYEIATPGVGQADNTTVRLDLDNEPQPDVTLIISPAYGGQIKISADDYLEGPPEFVAEVAASSVSIDLHAKLNAYRRNGVREYLIWRVFDEAIDWFILRGGEYVRLEPIDGILRSAVFPGLWLDPAALIRQEMPRVLQVVQQGIATTEHAQFVTQLAERAAKSGLQT